MRIYVIVDTPTGYLTFSSRHGRRNFYWRQTNTASFWEVIGMVRLYYNKPSFEILIKRKK